MDPKIHELREQLQELILTGADLLEKIENAVPEYPVNPIPQQVREGQIAMVQELLDSDFDHVSDWLEDFLPSIMAQLEDGKSLSVKQASCLCAAYARFVNSRTRAFA